ncbi:unnamed protein product [Polarella glacialis]|uniref:Uncharacterized protein n=1 Tax=Polarella glacialis TaxID=89957 RepID=A0A813KSY2_POLGL|nr:unnamed protein product [Polarella glacialis]
MKDTCGIVKAFKDMGMNFSGSIDPEPEMLLAILRHISLIERKAESRKIASNFGKTVTKLVENKVDLHSKVDSYTGDFFFIFRVATLIKGICAILDIRVQFSVFPNHVIQIADRSKQQQNNNNTTSKSQQTVISNTLRLSSSTFLYRSVEKP